MDALEVGTPAYFTDSGHIFSLPVSYNKRFNLLVIANAASGDTVTDLKTEVSIDGEIFVAVGSSKTASAAATPIACNVKAISGQFVKISATDASLFQALIN